MYLINREIVGMKRWHRFDDGYSLRFSFGKADQADRYLKTINVQHAMNYYVATELDEGEDPVAEGLVVDFNSSLMLLKRYRLRQSPQAE